MAVDDLRIDQIVKQVLERLEKEGITAGSLGQISMQSKVVTGRNGIHKTVDEAVAAARKAQVRLMEMSLEDRKKIIQAMREAAISHAQELGRMAVEETGLGRVPHKIAKIVLAAEKTPGVEDIEPRAFSGDHGLTLVEKAPYGVVGSITPSTNPPSTIVNNGISMVAAGNAVVFNPHPGAKRVSNRAVEILNQAIVSVGGPENLLNSIESPTLETSEQLMSHKGVDLLVVTGGGVVVRKAMRSGKTTIAAGPGNPPVVVDETADLDRAARCIVDGASFDNNVLCVAEKEIIAVASIADELKRRMKSYGAYEISGTDVERLMKVVFKDFSDPKHPTLNKEMVGKDAKYILAQIGIHVSDEIRLIFCETDADHPFVWTEMLMPVIPLVCVSDVDEAIKLAVEVEQQNYHTAIMHSRNIESLSKMARLCNCNIFVKNGPSYAGLGYEGEGYTTLTIAGTTGDGLTSARTFTRERRCVLIDHFRII
ncbi:aldehyde dehydrogenase EutE [Anoxybacter fermentans]|uniref:Aldehyde dehydrogenase EutE n=1 Tax=Anoxybacter fermentans TaxID=1323375 RepID=A0A3Q9HQF2_9FIRM|nr:aldehyde dehydrogenase family protein [Anoxybacter fermentans]AZR72300.1 aldehyde dehydrogenase EutE [Anoxybacter fermentans]